MTSYAVGHLRNVTMGSGIIEYLERIDETLAPFSGRFIIHGGRADMKEGDWRGDLIVIAFPDREAVEAWYASPAYRAIKPLRSENSEGEIFLIDGVDADHQATDVLTTGAS